MQVGHVAVAATIASYAPQISTLAGGPSMRPFSVEALAVAFVTHWLPNFDVVPIKLGWAKDSFHCTWSHTFVFVALVSLLLWPINATWALMGLISLVVHFLADMGSSVGLPLLMPLTNKRFTLNLWADTGHSGWFTFVGSYQQSWTWVLEGGMFVVLLVRAYQVGVWPF
jgi:membrane-bound metal-dependent hydrolase YbcI (DUF457 family)